MKPARFLLVCSLASVVSAQNYDEALVPDYRLPDPLVFTDGSPVATASDWTDKRRAEVLALFEEHVYGKAPAPARDGRTQMATVSRNALGGTATRKEGTLYLGRGDDALPLNVLIYVPNDREGPAPAFVALNFFGNHSIHLDPGITLSTAWMRENDEYGIVEHRASERSRGVRAHRWPVERIIERGYALVTLYYGDIDPDYDDGFRNGVHPFFYRDGQSEPGPSDWGSIAAWSWGLSRVMDALVVDEDIDDGRVALMGHSRLGKAALWAGATDERFALVISNNSGCGGAALSRRHFGETLEAINTRFPHWFSKRFHAYNEREAELPVDQHMLLSLIAPRPLYVASAEQDQWADPRGEFLSLKHASPVYELLGVEGLSVDEMPDVERPVSGALGYHIRRGKHDVTDYDWERFLDFADRHLGSH